MAKIKTIDAVKGTIKTIDKAAVASERIVEWSVPFRGRSISSQAVQRAGGLYFIRMERQAGQWVSIFALATLRGSVSPLGVPSSPSFHLTAACAPSQ